MAKKRGPDTFISRLFTRHEDLRKIEGRRAREMARVMKDVKKQALGLIERNMTTFREAGEYIDSAAALSRAEQTVAGIDALMAQRADWATTNVLSMRQEAWTQGVSDIQFASQRLPGGIQASMEASFGQVFPEAAFSAVEHPVLGVAPNAMFNGVRAGTTQNMRNVLVNAVVNGESVRETGRRLSDAMDISVAAGERIARTNVNAAYNTAHKAVYDANSDIIAGYAWEATLDDRTSQVCFMLHGEFWPTGSKTPGPPAHWNCRSILVPVFRDPTVQALLDDTPRRARQYDKRGKVRNVLVRGNMTPEQWARRQPSDITLRITGSKLKNSLFRRKLIGFDDLVDPSLRVRTDEEIIRRAAGLHPANKALAAKARALGAKTIPSEAAIQKADAALAKKQPWRTPKEVPSQSELRLKRPTGAPVTPTTESYSKWAKSLSEEQTTLLKRYADTPYHETLRARTTLSEKEFRNWLVKRHPTWKRSRISRAMIKTKENADLFNDTIASAPKSAGRLWRGLKTLSESQLRAFREAREITFNAASSVGTETIARQFAAEGLTDRNVLFKIRYRSGVSMRAFSRKEMLQYRERILPADTRFRVVSVRDISWKHTDLYDKVSSWDAEAVEIVLEEI